MAKNRISYGVQDVFFGSPEGVTDISVTGVSGGNSDGYQVLSRLYRVQDFNYSFELPKEQVAVLGRTSSVSSQLTAPPSVNVNFSYISDGINNENRMGLSLRKSRVETPVQFISGLFDRSTDRKNIYLQINPEEKEEVRSQRTGGYPEPLFPTGHLVTGQVADPNASNYDYLIFQNSYINNYSVSLGVGELVSVSVGAVADNVFMERDIQFKGVPYINTQTAETGFSGMALLIPDHFKPTNIENPSVPLVPSNISLQLTKRSDTGINFEIDTVQSCSVSLDLGRENISYLNYKLYNDRPLNLPVGISVDLSYLTSGSLTGNLYQDFVLDDQYDLNVIFKTGLGVQHMVYDISGLRLASVDFSSAIGSNKQSSLNFVGDFDLDDNDKGFFVSGSVMNIEPLQIVVTDGGVDKNVVTGGSGIDTTASPFLQPRY